MGPHETAARAWLALPPPPQLQLTPRARGSRTTKQSLVFALSILKLEQELVA